MEGHQVWCSLTAVPGKAQLKFNIHGIQRGDGDHTFCVSGQEPRWLIRFYPNVGILSYFHTSYLIWTTSGMKYLYAGFILKGLKLCGSITKV